jgi:WD40 repeat protein
MEGREHQATVHPSADQLQRFGRGLLPPAEAAVLEEHLGACDACCRLLEAMPVDSFLGRLREAKNGPVADTLCFGGDSSSCTDGIPTELAKHPRYHVIRLLGRGGMGAVYLAEHRRMGRLVALKVINAELLNHVGALSRFQQEVKAAAKLDHPNIVAAYDADQAGEMHFLVMEHVEGQNLADYLAESGPLPLSQACDIIEQAALGLQHAHERGMVHRDIKPHNLMLTPAGQVKVLDFGLARFARETGAAPAGEAATSAHLTGIGAVIGTADYIAPEQARDAHLADGRSDIYSLGCTLYHLLTGRPPFRAATVMETLEQVVNDEPLPLRLLLPHVPRDLETICLKCLHKSAARRYESARALADDLGRFLEHRPIHARRTGPLERAGRWCRRNPAVASLLGAVAASLLLGTISSTYFAVVASRRAEQAEQAQRQGEEIQLQAHLSEARARRFFSGRAGQRFGTLAAVARAVEVAQRLNKPAEEFDEMRNEMRNLAIAALALPDYRPATEWVEWGQQQQFPPRKEFHYARAWARQQPYVAFTNSSNGDITVERVADAALVAHLPGQGKSVEHRFLRDGSLFLFDHADRSFKRWRFQTNELKPLATSTADQIRFDFTPDGRLLWTLHEDGSITVFDFPSFRPLRRIALARRLVPPAAFGGEAVCQMHPFRHQMALSLGREGDPERRLVGIIDLDSGKLLATLDRSTGEATGFMAWLFDGETLAVGYSQSVVVWDVATRKPLHVLTTHKGGQLDAHTNCTGELLMTYSRGGGGCKLWHPHTGKLLLSLPNLFITTSAVPFADGRLWGVQWSGDHSQPALIDLARECRTLLRHPRRPDAGEYRMTAIHKAGRLAAVGTRNGVTLLDLTSGTDVGFLDLGRNDGVAFDPATGDLLTYGQRGLFRWPVQTMTEQPARLRVGPPRRLPVAPGGADQAVRISPDGKTIAVAQRKRVTVLREGRTDQPIVLQPLEDVRQHLALSPDGKWVATGRHDEPGSGDVRVWDIEARKVVKTFGIDRAMRVGFSPDGRWLVANDRSHYHFWHTGTWEPGTQRPVKYGFGELTFSPNGRMLALERWDGAVRLVETATGKELAVLEDPEQGRSSQATFSPDGTQLLLTNKDHAVLRLWDLRRLREGLKRLDLDWAAPPYPPEDRVPTVVTRPRLLDVEIAGADRVTDPRTPGN